MKFNKLFLMMFAMVLLVTTMVSANIDITEHHRVVNENLSFEYHTFDENGYMIAPSLCTWNLYQDDVLYEDGEDAILNVPLDYGNYQLNIYCEDNATGGFATFDDISRDRETRFGLWKPVEDWTFPGIYLLLTIILLALAFSYESSLLGVLGSVMLIMSYFIVGATSPILFTPLLIVGFLLAFKFATL